jgi:hypothetical protein
MMKHLYLIFVLLLIANGCASTDFCSSSNLSKIHTALGHVKDAPDDEYFEDPCVGCDDITLVGLSLDQIQSCLGTPIEPNVNDEHSIIYMFYKFEKPPEGYFPVGGGPELHLQFGPDNICTSAKWVYTQ